MPRVFVLMLLSLPFLALSVRADVEQAFPLPNNGNSLWGIGATGILCVTEPCPNRGIFPVNRGEDRTLRLSNVIPLLPRLSGTDAQRREIEAAWDSYRCIVVEGRIQNGILMVADLKGAC